MSAAAGEHGGRSELIQHRADRLVTPVRQRSETPGHGRDLGPVVPHAERPLADGFVPVTRTGPEVSDFQGQQVRITGPGSALQQQLQGNLGSEDGLVEARQLAVRRGRRIHVDPGRGSPADGIEGIELGKHAELQRPHLRGARIPVQERIHERQDRLRPAVGPDHALQREKGPGRARLTIENLPQQALGAREVAGGFEARRLAHHPAGLRTTPGRLRVGRGRSDHEPGRDRQRDEGEAPHGPRHRPPPLVGPRFRRSK